MKSKRPSALITAVLLLSGVLSGALLGGCGGDASEAGSEIEPETISREIFVATYVDLRIEALRNPSGEILPPQRERVLAEHEVTEDDLLLFAEVHGDDVDYMRSLWDEIEREINRRRGVEPDSGH